MFQNPVLVGGTLRSFAGMVKEKTVKTTGRIREAAENEAIIFYEKEQQRFAGRCINIKKDPAPAARENQGLQRLGKGNPDLYKINKR